jgi:hypothetical protein
VPETDGFGDLAAADSVAKARGKRHDDNLPQGTRRFLRGASRVQENEDFHD